MSFTHTKRLSIGVSLAMAVFYVGCVDLTPPWDKESVQPGGLGGADASLNPGTGGVGAAGSGP